MIHYCWFGGKPLPKVDRERSSLKIWNGLHMVKGKTKGHTERFQK